jgi:hypothetical protein
LPAVSGAAIVATNVTRANAIRYTEIGQVAPPVQAMKVAAANGVRPPLMAAPIWKPSEAPL